MLSVRQCQAFPQRNRENVALSIDLCKESSTSELSHWTAGEDRLRNPRRHSDPDPRPQRYSIGEVPWYTTRLRVVS